MLAGTEVGRASSLPGFSITNCHSYLIWLFGKLEAYPTTSSAAPGRRRRDWSIRFVLPTPSPSGSGLDESAGKRSLRRHKQVARPCPLAPSPPLSHAKVDRLCYSVHC
jgi:hypothetical protein